MAKIHKVKAWVNDALSTIYPLTIPQAVINPKTKVVSGYDEEQVAAQAFSELRGKVEALEELVKKAEFDTVRVRSLTVLDGIQINGYDLFVISDHAPDVAPDGVPQFWINTTTGDFYSAYNTTSVAHFKLI